jgi:hypothetical protein
VARTQKHLRRKSGDYDSDAIDNASGVAGSSVSDALDALDAAIPSVPVSSVHGRTGAVAANTGDYDSDQISNASSVAGGNVSAALDQLDSDIAGIPTFTPSYMGRQNNSVQNLNGTAVAVNWNQQVAASGSDITYSLANPSRIELNTTGNYRVSVNLKGSTVSTQRAAITAQLRQNGVAMRGPISACGYIRYVSGHDESSVHLAPFVYPFTAGDYIEVICNQEAASGAWNSDSGLCSILVEYLGT